METVAELSKKAGIRERVLREIRTFAARYGVEKVILFGSRARGDFRERSDIDLAFTGGDGARFSLDVDAVHVRHREPRQAGTAGTTGFHPARGNRNL